MSTSGGASGAAVDARGSTRVNAHWRARVLVSPEAFIEGRTINVSEGGVSLLLDRRFPNGAPLTVALAVPDTTDRTRLIPLTAQVRVIFNVASGDQFRLGLQFTQMSDEGRQAIRRWVSLLS
jgi:c-di-GMP-binding flagellar brake protein YcgR